jgi:hypothetical protein
MEASKARHRSEYFRSQSVSSIGPRSINGHKPSLRPVLDYRSARGHALGRFATVCRALSMGHGPWAVQPFLSAAVYGISDSQTAGGGGDLLRSAVLNQGRVHTFSRSEQPQVLDWISKISVHC